MRRARSTAEPWRPIAKLRPGTAHRNGSEQMPRFQQLRRTEDNTEIDGNPVMFQS
jgi:hypothetical protein